MPELTRYPRSFASYVLLERLGKGGMSQVDLARRSVGDGSYVRFCAIKRIHADNGTDDLYVRMFHDEARINAELHHENIAQVYDFGVEDGEFFLAMEYVPGLDLRDIQRRLHKRGQRMPVRVVLTVLKQVLAGLHHAHTATDTMGRPMRVVHRDVNPRNVMLSVRGTVKLIDFGVARAEDRLERTEGQVIKGKFAYMAPEQIEGREIDHRADLYAVGMMLHELINGQNPLVGLNQVQVLHRVLNGSVGELEVGSDYPEPEVLEALHAWALAKKPGERFPDAAAFAAAVDEALVPVGGACTRTELAAFLREVDPEGVAGIGTRLQTYNTTATDEIEVHAPEEPVIDEGSLSRGGAETTWSSERSTVGPPLVGGVVLGAVVTGLLVGAVLWLGRTPEAPVQVIDPPSATEGFVEVAEPAPEPAPEPVQVVEEAPTSEPVLAEPERVQRVPVERRAPPAVEPEPEPEAEPIDEPAPTPVAAPVDQATGYLFLASRPTGLGVVLDGQTTDLVTPLRLHELSVGAHSIQLVRTDGSWSDPREVVITEGAASTLQFRLEGP